MKNLLSKITLQDVLLIGFVLVVLFTGASAIAKEMNGTLNAFNGSF